MNTQPLLFLGDTRRRVLLARFADGARRWRKFWVPDNTETFEAQCEAPSVSGFANPVASVATSCWALEISGERIAVLLLPHVTFTWSVQESGALAADSGGTVDADSLADRLELEVATSLFTELCATKQQEVFNVTRIGADTLQSWSRAARAWNLHLRALGSGRNFTLLVAACRIESLAPARAPAGPRGVESRHEAIGGNAVGLRAMVGEASMSVTELAGLAVDDVLVLDQHLSEPVTLIAQHSGLAVAAGNLGRAGARRAVKVAGISQLKN